MPGVSKSILLLPGFTEGGWHVRQFEKACRRRGYSITKDILSADFVIAHSGGCYTIPPLKDEQILMFINPTYWPGRSLGKRGLSMTLQILKSIRPGNRPLYHLWKTMHNLFYFFYNYQLNMVMVQQSRTYNLEEAVSHQRTVLVRNYHDPWLTDDLEALERANPNLRIERLEGEHDDCWLHPDRYIDLLERPHDA